MLHRQYVIFDKPGIPLWSKEQDNTPQIRWAICPKQLLESLQINHSVCCISLLQHTCSAMV